MCAYSLFGKDSMLAKGNAAERMSMVCIKGRDYLATFSENGKITILARVVPAGSHSLHRTSKFVLTREIDPKGLRLEPLHAMEKANLELEYSRKEFFKKLNEGKD